MKKAIFLAASAAFFVSTAHASDVVPNHIRHPLHMAAVKMLAPKSVVRVGATTATVASAATPAPTLAPGGLSNANIIAGLSWSALLGDTATYADNSVQQADIGSTVAGLDSSGNVTAPVNSSLVTVLGGLGNGHRIIDPLHTKLSTKLYYDANEYEFTIENGAAENNTLAIKNTNSCGLAATAFVGYDTPYKRLSEHGAIGWGPCLAYFNQPGYDYLEISRYPYALDGYADDIGKEEPVPFLLQKTGIEIVPYGMNEGWGTVTKGSTSITCVGCTWGAGISAGMLVTTPDQPGVFPVGTTVVSGGGTSTLVVSNAATVDLIDATKGTLFRIGNTEYSQHDWFEDSAMGNLNFWTFGGAKWGAFYGSPFVSFDRNNGRTGFGGEQHPVLPADSKGGVGGNVSGEHPDSSNYGGQNAALNAQVLPGSDSAHNTIANFFGYQNDRLQIRWETSPSRIEYYDANNNMVYWTLYIGVPSGETVGQSKQTAHPVQSITADYTASVPSDCGTTLNVTATVATTVTLPQYMPQGCAIAVIQYGSGAVSLAAGSGASIHYNSGGTPTTGTYSLSGQYAGAHVEYLDQQNIVVTGAL